LIVRKTPEEIDKIAAAGTILAGCLAMLRDKAKPGVTTGELDDAAEHYIRSRQAEPAFKGYRGFPGSICTSPNSMVVHGIPGDYALERGDILSIDVGVVRDDWVADAAITVPIGRVSPVAKRLLAATRAALFEAVERCRPGTRLGDVSNAVQTAVEAEGFAVVRSLVGHGIGRDMHEDPQIPNFGDAGAGPELLEGMVLAVEPMVNAGTHGIRMGSDHWSVYSEDGSLAAHFEHTVAITADGPRILTPWHLEEGPAVPRRSAREAAGRSA
jgi:methionyl aminopeptidase